MKHFAKLTGAALALSLGLATAGAAQVKISLDSPPD